MPLRKTGSAITDCLDEINHLVNTVKVQEAEARFRSLLEDLDPAEKLSLRDALEQTLNRFHKK